MLIFGFGKTLGKLRMGRGRGYFGKSNKSFKQNQIEDDRVVQREMGK